MVKIQDRLYELDILLNYIDTQDWLKIPDEIIFYIKNNKSTTYAWQYNEDIPFEEQKSFKKFLQFIVRYANIFSGANTHIMRFCRQSP